jgi:hypothetical protein
VFSDVVAGVVTPGPPVTTVRLLLVGITPAAAVVHQLAEALSAKVYVLVLARSFEPIVLPQSLVLVEPVLPKSKSEGAPPGALSDTSMSLTHVCRALKSTETDWTVPVNPATVNVTSVGAPPVLPQVGVPAPSAKIPSDGAFAAKVAAGTATAAVVETAGLPACTEGFIERPKQNVMATRLSTIMVYSKDLADPFFSLLGIKFS